MAFPRKLKQMMMYVDGIGYAADTESVTLPKLARKLEKYRGGGMGRGAPIDMGGEDDLTVEHSYGCPVREIIRQYGVTTMSGVQIRFVGSYENDDTGETYSCEIVMRGRHREIDRGEQKPGEAGSFKVTSDLVYYKEVWDGVTDVEIDTLGMIEIVGGVDLMAAHRANLGLG